MPGTSVVRIICHSLVLAGWGREGVVDGQLLDRVTRFHCFLELFVHSACGATTKPNYNIQVAEMNGCAESRGGSHKLQPSGGCCAVRATLLARRRSVV